MNRRFSPRTLQEFEDASASIVLRQIVRAFDGADIRMGEDPGGAVGDRRTQFRRYVAGVDQHDPQQLNRLGDALGALIGAVAASKEEFLVKAAERDGFSFAAGVLRPAGTAPSAFAVRRAEDLASIDDRARRLHLLANESPEDAVAGARELVESVCRTVLRLIGEPAGRTADLVDLAESTLESIELVPADSDHDKKGAALMRGSLRQLSAVVAGLGKRRDLSASGGGYDGKSDGLSPRHARLAVGAAVAWAGFLAETYVSERDRP